MLRTPAAASGCGGLPSWPSRHLDGNRFTLSLCGSRLQDDRANEGGGAVFFVSNDRTGTMSIDHSTLLHNTGGRFETAGLPGIFFLGSGAPTVTGSTLAS